MGLSDDQRDEACKALRGAEEALEYLVKGVKAALHMPIRALPGQADVPRTQLNRQSDNACKP